MGTKCKRGNRFLTCEPEPRTSLSTLAQGNEDKPPQRTGSETNRFDRLAPARLNAPLTSRLPLAGGSLFGPPSLAGLFRAAMHRAQRGLRSGLCAFRTAALGGTPFADVESQGNNFDTTAGNARKFSLAAKKTIQIGCRGRLERNWTPRFPLAKLCTSGQNRQTAKSSPRRPAPD
ncbi:hypothetical protein AAFF_G00131440 [Aldrovandia affinis]|uniref:Uncharacterized protein n=1 Tax=Aldrovandia affinis TaxID=143900 RepID=A0AAD7RQP3_9TELE|nr:hypothetical protein AAFF_G00131440 [Aldrovandia affinis]